MSRKASNHDDISFEEAIQNLENIVHELEEGSLSLDDALGKFEQGIKLSRVCTQKLENAEKKIEMLLSSEDGDYIFKAVDLGENQNG